MLFNSLTFLIFLPTVFATYWLIRKGSLRVQNFLLIVASYVFYGWWDWRFLSLIVISSAVDYFVGLRLDHEERGGRRRALLMVSLSVNLGLLGFFKYFNFFAESFAALMGRFGLHADHATLNVILPVGISFYTFQTLSYSIDLYRRKIPVCRDAIAFFAFVSFFPQLVAGPIERAKALLPQFLVRRTFDSAQATDGMRQILWGFFKKVVIADNLAPHVERIFSGGGGPDSVTGIAGVVFFALQIYCDFSGYSDIAIGTARLFGFRLMRNFAYPYFSRDIAEFWRRWHISLSSWFRDYVYIPLGGSRTSKARRIVNIIVTFTVSGLWHGANWTFVFWGFLNGLYYIPLMLADQQKKNVGTVAEGRILPSLADAARMFLTFLLALLAWVFFRAASLGDAFRYIGSIFSGPISVGGHGRLVLPFVFCLTLLTAEWFGRTRQHALQIGDAPRAVRWFVYLVVLFATLILGRFTETTFIYFQF